MKTRLHLGRLWKDNMAECWEEAIERSRVCHNSTMSRVLHLAKRLR